MNSQYSNQPQPQSQNPNQLNISRFLIQQLNLQDQPTQQQILQRAQELQIDDLIMARQSLTKQLDSEWKPYCNRLSEIYYINLEEKKAYIDHPIDMYYKKQYAKINGLPIPRFKSYKIENIAQNLELIQQEIRNYKTQSHKTTLRIVYEEPSQEEALSSHPKSPMNYQDNFYQDQQREEQNQELNAEEIEELLEYQRKLEEKYQNLYTQKKKQYNSKLKNKQAQHDKSMGKIIDRKIEEYCQKYQEQVTRKNKLDLQKQKQRIDIEYQEKRMIFCQNIQKFNIIFERLREKQRNAEQIFQEKNAAERVMIVESIHQKSQFQKQKAIIQLKNRLIKQFNQKIISVVGSSKDYQQKLKKQIQQIFISSENITGKNYQRTTNRYRRPGRKLIFNNEVGKRGVDKLKEDIQYQELRKEIKNLSLWQSNQQNVPTAEQKLHSKYLADRYSLNLRLRMRII